MQKTVNATRMQLITFRRRLKIAVRGHKLLKDKQDELVKAFLELARECQKLRRDLKERLAEASSYQRLAALSMPASALKEALLFSGKRMILEYRQESVLGINVPHFELQSGEAEKAQVRYPYGFAFTSGNLDESLERLAETFPLLIKLAAMEKAVDRLADELERTRRRVNALEHILIPQLKENVKFIEMKLDEMERSNVVRLMKINEQREAAH
ncbi:MAG: V-type ATP synthase subunit D [Firmicutes bacterium]|nr:V-type ATP synthase subunit D [Bacillota bacterium]